MPAPGVLLLITVVLIVLALVYSLVSTIFALRRSPPASTRRSPPSSRSSRRRGPVNAVVDDINANLDAAVDALEGLLVKKAGMDDASALSTASIPARPRKASATSPRAARQAAADLRGLHARHADARAARPRGADRGRQPGGGPVLRNVTAAAWPPARSTPSQRPGRARRSSAPTRPCNTRNGCRLQRRLSTSGRPASKARSPRCA